MSRVRSTMPPPELLRALLDASTVARQRLGEDRAGAPSMLARLLWHAAEGAAGSGGDDVLAEIVADSPRLGQWRPRPEEIGVLYEASMDATGPASEGRWSGAQGRARRRTGSYYTPPDLADEVVARAIEPWLAERDRGDGHGSERWLALRVCDPAMGCGAFLLAACRRLSEGLLAAWHREGELDRAVSPERRRAHARSLVARRCLVGVDSNPDAVLLARLALWIDCGRPGEPGAFLARSLFHGDALVGASTDELGAIGVDERLDRDTARTAADALVGAAFEAGSARARRQERARRAAAIGAWLRRARPSPAPVELRAWAELARTRVRPFHWELELPELRDGRPLAVVGNPPFMGKNAIVARGGAAYLEWLLSLHSGAHGNADLCAHFLRRAAWLVGERGSVGFITTNTIAQGDTRATGLQALVREGFEIYDATASMPWPGDASVSVSVVHLARGLVTGQPRLGGRAVGAIDSRLGRGREQPDPRPLAANHGRAFVGSYVLGKGFLLTASQREELLRSNPRNAERILPYLGGAEVNTSPTHAFHRYVIDFGDLELSCARARWPELLAIVEREVRPERARNKRPAYRDRWWHFGEKRPALYRALRPLRRCLVAARVSKHLCVSFQPVGRVFSEQLVVFALDGDEHLALLQSRVHELWARRHSSSLEDRLRYSVSASFETFPLPDELASLREHGEALHRARAAFMQRTGQGLTKVYNALSDPAERGSEVQALRALHLELDRAVLRAYGWADIEVPPLTEPELQGVRGAVVDRLLALNAARGAR